MCHRYVTSVKQTVLEWTTNPVCAVISVQAVSWRDMGIGSPDKAMHVVDVWSNKTVAASAIGSITFTVAEQNDNAFYRLCPTK